MRCFKLAERDWTNLICKYFGSNPFPILAQIIIGSKRYYSFADEGILGLIRVPEGILF